MEKKEEEFLAKLLATFRIEADEHLHNLNDTLVKIESGLPDEQKKESLDFIFREAHSLKGAARAVSFSAVERICQALESVLSAWRQQKIIPSPLLFDTCYTTLDTIEKILREQNPQDISPHPDEIETLIGKIHALTSEIPLQKQEVKPNISPSSISLDPPIPTHPPTPKEEKQEPPHPASILEKDKTIRVSSVKLDHLLQQVEELLLVKSTANQRVQELDHIKELLSQLDQEWGRIQSDYYSLLQIVEKNEENFLNPRIIQFLQWHEGFVKIFRDYIIQANRAANQDQRVLSTMVDNLLEDTKKVLMQPVSTLFEIVPRMVRDLAHALGKEIKLDLNGGDIEVDRRILEELKDPLIHLIRNSLDHGIESSEERKRLNKPLAGKLTISASQVSGNYVEIRISDDGRGIQIDKIRESIIQKGLLSEGEANKLNPQDWLNLLFKSKISTASTITELSGRGIGLNVVSDKVEKLGGQISIEFQPHVGTTFILLLPLTLATFRGIHIKASNQDFILPTQHVKRVLRIPQDQIKTIEDKQTIQVEGEILAFFSLSEVLGLPPQPVSPSYPYIVLIVTAAKTNIAFRIDQIISEQEVLIKNLGKQLVRVRFISAATIMEWGKIIPILDPFDLIKSVTHRSSLTPPTLAIPKLARKKQKILVVEDSITVRVLLKNILESAGYDVKTAIDGAEAFTILKTEPVDLLLSDIEMPRLNGLELTEQVRKTEELSHLPIILCTSHGSKEDREKGIEVGADAYMDKSSFTHSSLLEIIKKLI